MGSWRLPSTPTSRATPPAASTGTPARGHRHGRERDGRGEDADEDVAPIAEPWPQQGEERGAHGGVEPERAGVADGLAGDRPDGGRDVPQDEDRDPGGEEAQAGALGGVAGDPHRRRLVDQHVGGRHAPPAAPAQQRRHPEAVEGVAGAEQQRRRRTRHRGATRGHDADEGELAGAGEHQQGQHARLGDAQAGGHRRRRRSRSRTPRWPDRPPGCRGRSPSAQRD